MDKHLPRSMMESDVGKITICKFQFDSDFVDETDKARPFPVLSAKG